MADQNDAIRQAVEANHALGVAGHADLVWGHVSVRDPDGRGLWMKAAGWAFEEVTPERLVLVAPDGEVLAGDGPRHVEYPIHAQIMAARPEVDAVVHTHAPHAATFASLGVPLRAVSHDAVPFLDPDVPRFTRTGNLIITDQLGAALAETLGAGAGVLLASHGLVTAGETVAAAVMRAVLLERACASHLTALAAGGPTLWSDEEEIQAKRRTYLSPQFYQSGYNYLLRRAAAEGAR